MSRRHGRNRKRKDALEIKTLNECVTNQITKISLLHMSLARNKRIVENTARVLGPHFIALDPEVIRQGNPHLEYWRTTPFEDFNYFSAEDSSNFVNEVIRTLELPVMGFKAMRDELRSEMHFRIMYKDKYVGYAIKDSDLRNMPKEVAIDIISREMARFVREELE